MYAYRPPLPTCARSLAIRPGRLSISRRACCSASYVCHHACAKSSMSCGGARRSSSLGPSIKPDRPAPPPEPPPPPVEANQPALGGPPCRGCLDGSHCSCEVQASENRWRRHNNSCASASSRNMQRSLASCSSEICASHSRCSRSARARLAAAVGSGIGLPNTDWTKSQVSSGVAPLARLPVCL